MRVISVPRIDNMLFRKIDILYIVNEMKSSSVIYTTAMKKNLKRNL